VEHAVDGGATDAVFPGDLADAPAVLTVAEDAFAVKIECRASDVAALKTGTPHAGADPFDDQVAFELRDRADDDDDGAAQRAAGVDALPEADELDVEPVELVEHFEEVPGRAGDAIRGPDQDHIEAAAAGIPHQAIQTGPARLHAGDLVSHLRDDLIAALRGHLAEVMELGLGVLVDGRDPHI